MRISEGLQRRYEEDGVVKLDGVLDAHWLTEARMRFDWSSKNLGPHGKGGAWLDDSTETFEDKANPAAPAAYESFLRDSPLADLAAEMWDGGEVWFMYEQVFKKAGVCRRTPWHQDSSYLAVDGRHLIVFWISLAPVPKSEALEFAAGSHRGPLYNGSTFDIDDPTDPIYPGTELPRLPDVDRNRDAWNIVSWDTELGDVLAFHPKILHGGGATTAAARETLSLRFFGPDAVYTARPGPCGPRIAGLHDSLADGAPFRHPAFLKLR